MHVPRLRRVTSPFIKESHAFFHLSSYRQHTQRMRSSYSKLTSPEPDRLTIRAGGLPRIRTSPEPATLIIAEADA